MPQCRFAFPSLTNPLTVGGWPLLFTPCATAMAAICTQTFLGYRWLSSPFHTSAAPLSAFYLLYSIYRLTGNKIIFGIIMAISIPAFIVGMVVGAEAIVISLYVFPSFLILVVKLKPCTLLVRLADLPRINNIVIAWLSGQVAADIMITGKSACCFSFCLASSLTLLVYCYFFSWNLW